MTRKQSQPSLAWDSHDQAQTQRRFICIKTCNGVRCYSCHQGFAAPTDYASHSDIDFFSRTSLTDDHSSIRSFSQDSSPSNNYQVPKFTVRPINQGCEPYNPISPSIARSESLEIHAPLNRSYPLPSKLPLAILLPVFGRRKCHC